MSDEESERRKKTETCQDDIESSEGKERNGQLLPTY
jgi:hypothetical protein